MTRVGQSDTTVTHAQAREIVRRAWQLVHGRSPTDRELAYTQSIALLETSYGRTPQFLPWVAEGQYNWGALQRGRLPDGTCPPGTRAGTDAGNLRCFFVFGSDLEAARRYIWALTANPSFPARNREVLAAMNEGSSLDVATAMKTRSPTSAWFEKSVEAYAKDIQAGLRMIRSPLALTDVPAGVSPPWAFILALALGGGAYWWLSQSYKPARSGRR